MVTINSSLVTVSPLDRFIIIRNHPFFHSLTNDDILAIIEKLTEVSFSPGENIVIEGKHVDSFYFIVEGEAEVIKNNISSTNKRIDDIALGAMYKGDAIGLNNKEFYSTDGKQTTTVRALSPIKLLRIHLTDFCQLLQNTHDAQSKTVMIADWILKIDFIKQAFPFSHTTVDRLCEVTTQIEEILLQPGTLIYNIYDAADRCYLIHSGQVQIYIPEPEEKKITVLESGAIFGETDLLTSSKRGTAARAVTTCKLFVFPHDLLVELVKNNEPIGQAFIGMVLKRMRPERMEGITEHKRHGVDGATTIMLHNNKLAQVYRLTKEGVFIWELINGENSLQHITTQFFKSTNVFAPEMIYNFLYNLAELKFIKIPEITVSPLVTSFERIYLKIEKIFRVEYVFKNADNTLSTWYKNGIRLLFSWPAQVGMVTIIAWGMYTFFQYPFSVTAFTSKPHYLILLFLFVFITSIFTTSLHELAHAFTTKRFGYQIQRLGFSWAWFELVMFADTSELWLADRWPRIVVDFAGIYWDLFMASLFALSAYYLPPSEFDTFLWVYSLILYINSYRNLSPLKEYDGYFIIADAFDLPKLREMSIEWLTTRYHHLFRNPSTEIRHHRPEITYWIVCLIYLIVYAVIVFSTLQFFTHAFHLTTLFHLPVVNWIVIVTLYTVLSPILKILLRKIGRKKRMIK
jgi:CRP-like cAMP-binding protein